MRPLTDAATLAARLGDPGWVVVDCRFRLDAPEAGEAAWREGHIPGAVYAHLERDLSGPVTAASGRHPLPAPGPLMARLGAWGIGPGTTVVAYDDAGGAFAARLWWLLRWLGHRRVAVLDGGLAAWLAAGGGLARDRGAVRPCRFEGRPGGMPTVDAEAVRAGGWCLVDARAPERYRGEEEPIDPVAGHIPGAVNLPFTGNLDRAGRFLPPAALARRFAALGAAPQRVVHYCGSGVTACHNLLAMELAGLAGARLYPGSWSEWIRDPARAVARGPAP
ncbi:sulfurtransferase [Inmirania thermothiophila]|uniref:Sulfurtransferase n=1 Tax=Inmirania thermothiophila TaxID=1750597 RepID=A0A3N1Y972_9GAMM|nr:sulfurtransferase [Inmirania thermothiophila]ROR34152.1 thiosulfate/3-mercaptopyruvate sulfurtransferase [Inmirania thermothiophila]